MPPNVKHLAWSLLGIILLAMPARAATQRITFLASPPDASVTQLGPPDRPLGSAGQPVLVLIPDGASDSTRLTFRFTRDGYEAAELSPQIFQLRGATSYPLTPVTLRATASWRSYRGLLAVCAALLAALAVVGLRHGRSVKAAQEELRDAHTLSTVRVNRANTTVGDYALIGRIGEGASAEVYQGIRLSDPDSPEVALKIMRFTDASQVDAVRGRFQRQVEILSKLTHPSIVRLLDWGEDDDALFMVEELCAGGHLQIPPEGMSAEAFGRVFTPLVEAMAYAHEQGVVHRDLKPENVLLTPEGQVKVSDFGIARMDDGATITSHRRIGTPLYMAPELLAGQHATAAADQYALGVMAYQMLSGRLPHAGETVAELMKQRLSPPPPLAQVPAALRQVIERMLAGDAAQRFASLHEVREALRAACS